MPSIFTIAIFIILIVIGLLFFLFMPKVTVFFKPYTDTVDIFKNNYDEIKKEIDLVNDNNPVIPIYGFNKIQSYKFPKTYGFLQCLPCVQSAGIINLKPVFQQVKQYGFAPSANGTIRYFFTINESCAGKSGIWVDGEKRFFSEKEWICADMSREHSLFNKDRWQTTTVLFVDIDRHESIPNGKSPNDDIKKDEVLKIFCL